MKRDMGIVIQMLQAIQSDKPSQTLQTAGFPDLENAVLVEHVRLLTGAGLLESSISRCEVRLRLRIRSP